MANTYDPYGLELSGVDPETSAELRKLKRQQDITDLLMQRGMESPQGKMVGDVYVKPSWTQGVSQLVNAYLSGQSQKGVDAGYQGIADKQKADETARLEAMNKTMTGTPEIAPVMAPSMAMNPNPDGSLQQVVANNPQAAVPGNPRKAVEDYLMSRSPLMGALQRAKGLEADQAREENIAQRKWEVQQRLLGTPGETRNIQVGAESVTQEKKPDGSWVEIGRGPKFARQVINVGYGGTGGSKPMTELQKSKFNKTIANDYKSAEQTMQQMANITKAVTDVSGSEGLSSREGYTGYIPAWLQGKDAMTAENRINTLKGKITQMGKAMATMSGAIGPMAVQEWKIVSDAVNAIDPTAGNLSEQLQNITDQANGAANRIKDIYERTYGDQFESMPQFDPVNFKLDATGGQSAAGKVGAPSNNGTVRIVDF